MSVDVRVRIDDQQVLAAIARLRMALPETGDMRPAMRQLAQVLKSQTQMRFRAKRGPDGTEWKTSRRAQEEGGQTLSLSRVLRNSILEVANEDYVRTARAKGLSPRVVLFRHILRNALMPVVTLAGLDLALLLGGVVVIEAVFGWPGVGLQAWTAIRNQDTPMIMGTVLFASIAVVFINLLVDFLYIALDPRIRLTKS